MVPIKGDDPMKQKSTSTLRIGAAYVRVSTDGQMDLSPESQLESILKYAKANNIVSEMLTYIHAHFREDPTLVALSDHIGLSPNYLSKLFHSHVGKTYKAYVVELKLKYASTLLSQTDTPVTDICYLCGFNSLAHFLRAFKEKFGVSPTVYRKENLLNK